MVIHPAHRSNWRFRQSSALNFIFGSLPIFLTNREWLSAKKSGSGSGVRIGSEKKSHSRFWLPIPKNRDRESVRESVREPDREWLFQNREWLFQNREWLFVILGAILGATLGHFEATLGPSLEPFWEPFLGHRWMNEEWYQGLMNIDVHEALSH